MRIDITRIDISHINKNKQSHRWVKLLSFFWTFVGLDTRNRDEGAFIVVFLANGIGFI